MLIATDLMITEIDEILHFRISSMCASFAAKLSPRRRRTSDLCMGIDQLIN